ncbi:MAG: T9SS type A sorting domain-containing protein, partial [Bacteroidota bacterium]
NPTVVGAWADFTPYNNHLYFSGFDHPHPGLWRYDGDSIRKVTVANTPAFDSPADFTVWQGKLYFIATDTANNRRVWHYDGTTISRVTAIPPLLDADCCGSNIIAYQGNLFFVHDDGIHGYELWKYNGFKSVLAADAWPGGQGSYPRAFTLANNQLYMLASDSLNSAKIIAYNGTQLDEIAPHLHVPLDFTRRPLSGYNGSLYFTGYPAHDLRFDSIAIYHYDGQQVHVVKDSTVAYGWVEFDGALYFGGADYYRTADLWEITAPLVNVAVPQRDAPDAGLRVYPNPSDGQLTIAWIAGTPAPGAIRILDLMGREVHRSRIEQPLAGQPATLSLGDHPAGMYTVIVEAGAMRHVQRLILR